MSYLESMPAGGFPYWWRTRVIQSPIFIPLQVNPEYLALQNTFEKEMARQLALILEKKDVNSEL